MRARLLLTAGACFVLLGCSTSKPVALSSEQRALGGLVEGAPSAQRLLDAAVFSQSEELVAACMKKSGFRYIPRKKVVSDASGWSSPENLRTRGYGLASEANDFTTASLTDDPNEKMLQKMRSAEQASYLAALQGPDWNNPTRAPERKGCAYQQLGGQTQIETMESSDQAAKRLEQDPAIRALDLKWSKCMKASGFAYSSRRDAVMKLRKELFTVVLPSASQRNQANGSGDLVLNEFKKKELAIARGDAACQLPQDEVKRAQLADQYVQKFLEQNFSGK